MYFYRLVKRLTIDIFAFAAFAVSAIFLYTQMLPFVKSAAALHYINGQTVSYLLYGILVTLMPLILVIHDMRLNKTKLLRAVFYATAAVILAGTAADLITYRFFAGYTFSEGEAVFVNIMWNLPGLSGAVLSLAAAAAYIALGVQITRRRRAAYALYALIILLTCAAPFLLTWLSSGGLPRVSWLEKNSFLIPAQLLTFVSLSICVTERELWLQHVWDYE